MLDYIYTFGLCADGHYYTM